MSFKTTLTLAAAATAIGLSGSALADSHGGGDDAHDDYADKALFIVTSDSLQTQGMAMILANAMREQGTTPHILLCDAAGELAIDGYESETELGPRGVKPEGLMQMMMGEGAGVDVCAIYLPNTDYEEGDLREGVGVAAPGPMAEMRRDPKIPVFSF
jgi:predicted peroxiredoxin